MSSGIASLHKILKDETRKKIILLLKEKGGLSYTDLMNALEINSTGKLNYHLRILEGLVLKREDGQYVLTERGVLASRLLLEFPEEDNQLQVKGKWWRRFWIAAILLQSAGLAVVLALYSLGSLDFSWMVRGVGFEPTNLCRIGASGLRLWPCWATPASDF